MRISALQQAEIQRLCELKKKKKHWGNIFFLWCITKLMPMIRHRSIKT